MGVECSQIALLSDDAAVVFVDEKLGEADSWHSPTLRYRFSRGSQADWKAELGQWLKRAEVLGFDNDLLERLVARANQILSNAKNGPNVNDNSHRILFQETAPAIAIHYFVGLGWRFVRWEPQSPPGTDIDFSLRTSTGCTVHFQAKGPGDDDRNLVTAMGKAAKQLENVRDGGRVVVISSLQRYWSCDPDIVIGEAYGHTRRQYEAVMLPADKQGLFFSEWRHLTAIALLDLVRGASRRQHACTVLCNPAADVQWDPEWLPSSRACLVEDGLFQWRGGCPAECADLPSGTRTVGRLEVK